VKNNSVIDKKIETRQNKHKMEDNKSNEEEEEYKVEEIVDKRVIPCSGGCNGIIGCDCGGRTEYRIKWLGWGSESNTWEPLKHLYCEDLIEEFEKTYHEQNHSKSVRTKRINRGRPPKNSEKHKHSSDINDVSNSVKLSRSRDENLKRVSSNKTSDSCLIDSKNFKANKRKKSVEFKEPIVQEKIIVDLDQKTTKTKNHSSNIDPNTQPEKIIGVADSGGELMFLVKWKGLEKVELVPAREANVKFTDMVVKFYEDRIQWHAGHLLASSTTEQEN